MPTKIERSPPKPASRKRLILACDGTWDNSDTYKRKSFLPWSEKVYIKPSNVTRIGRCIERHDPSVDREQIVYYQPGVGTADNVVDQLCGGLTGMGLSEHVRAAYGFLSHNYCDGDEIFIFGFSRGAFTARTIAAMIADIGLLSPRGMTFFYPIFKDWENKYTPGYVSKYLEPFAPNIKKPSFGAPGEPYQEYLTQRGFTERKIPIKCIGVWDTVGALGIPALGVFPQKPNSEYAFVNTEVCPNVEYAFQALALDEHRRPFSPTIWQTPRTQNDLAVLKQCWFAGSHSNVGGGYYEDAMSADISLAWMVSQLIEYGLLKIDEQYLSEMYEDNLAQYQRPWALGRIDETYNGPYLVTGSTTRTPSRYTETDGITGDHTDKPCYKTNEYVHASVRIRIGLKGKALDDKGHYQPPALKDWVCEGVQGKESAILWRLTSDHTTVMPEDKLSELEWKLLKKCPEVAQIFWGVQAKVEKD